MRKGARLVSVLLSTAMAASTIAAPVFAAGPGVQTDTSVTEHEKQSATNSLTLAQEGIVLLKNDSNALPVSKQANVALYGLGAVNTIKGGTGSGAVNNRVVYPDGTKKDGVSISVSVEEGFEYQNLNIVNKAFLDQTAADNPDSDAGGMAGMGGGTLHAEVDISHDQMTADAANADTAFYVIRRNAGEGADRTKTKGDWYLTDEELNNIKKMAATFKNSVVLLNVVSIDSTWIKDVEGLDSVVLIGNPGELGGIAVAQNIDGTVTPSGKTVDTWADIEDYPSTKYFAKLDADDPYGSSVEYYGEGIYTGYRYFDTFAADDIIYDFGYGLSYTDFSIDTESVEVSGGKVVVKANVTNTGDMYSGKEVVQVYFSAPDGELDKPYQELAAFGKTDTLAPGESQELTLSFDASDMSSYSEDKAAYILEAGDYIIRVGDSSRDTEAAASISVDKTVVTEQLANRFEMDEEGSATGGAAKGGQSNKPYSSALDITGEQSVANYQSAVDTFEAFAGEAVPLTGAAASDNKVSLDAASVENTANEAYASGDNEDVTTYVSDTTPSEGQSVKGYNYQTMKSYATDTTTFSGDYSQYTLQDVYNGTITLEEFVSGMTLGQLTDMVEGGNKSTKPAGQSGGGTSPNTADLSAEDDAKILSAYVPGEAGETCGLYITSKLIPNTTNADGPAGLRVSQSFEDNGTTYYQFETAYPAGQNNAQTWNVDAVYAEGVSVGQDMENAGVDVWLAPGMNIHRNPLCGRNFEYYSEDPLLAGKMAAAITKGVQSVPGRGVTLKHFALNNQETARNSTNSVVSERAIREIYLKQFEIAVTEAQPLCIMSSYNSINNVPASDNYDLLENVLRKEWGFKGMVMTDWGGSGGSSDARSMHAGNDIIMAGREVSANITSYITDVAPTWTENGYPRTSGSTMAFGTWAWVTINESWGDYTLDKNGSITLTQTVSKELFEAADTVAYRATNDAGTAYVGYRSAKAAVDALVTAGSASYVENEDSTVTVTYTVSRASDADNRSITTAKTASSYEAGKQDPVMSSVTGQEDDYNTLTLADLQKSNIRILYMVMHTGNFYNLIGETNPASYDEEMVADGVIASASASVGVEKGDIVEAPAKELFDDVKDESKYFFNPVYWAKDNGITTGIGDNLFGVGSEVKRGQMMQWLYLAAGSPEVKTTTNPFTDVSEDDYYYEAILWAVENGITSGITKTEFGPNEDCARLQIVFFLYKAKGGMKVESTNSFTDVEPTAFYYDAVNWAVANNITKGTTATTFGPLNTCTREQAVTFLNKAYA